MIDPIIRALLANRNLPPRTIQPQDAPDWRSNVGVSGGIPTGGPRAPDKLNPGPAPTGSERVYDAIRGYLPGGQVFDRMAGGVAPVAAAFTTDAYDIGQDYAKTGHPAMLAMSLLPGAKPVAKAAQAAARAGESALGKSVRAYHGSPHDFDRFDMNRIGTGEGAQAYGHGLYFAENEGVARKYRNQLGTREFDSVAFADHPELPDMVRTYLKDNFYDASDEAVSGLIQRISDSGSSPMWLDYDKLGVKLPGSMYEVNINASPDDFLDWDKPLAQQSDLVRRALSKVSLPDGIDNARDAIMIDQMSGNPSGGLEKSIREAGIPGIRYFDQGSRGAGEGSRNYVVFDDKLIEIMRKYGLLGPAALGAAAAGMPGDAEAGQ